MTALAPHVEAFFHDHLARDRGCSHHTRDAYAYAFRLLLCFAADRFNAAPSSLSLEQLDAPVVLAFLEHLETVRCNAPRTRNARLAAIKSFAHFIEYRVPSALNQMQRILAIPSKKTDEALVDYLERDELQALLDAPEPTTRMGIRDRAMLHLCFACGLRVSELIGLRLEHVRTHPHASVHIFGKGRRERVLPLWKETTVALRAWLAIRGEMPAKELFLNARGGPLSRSGVEYILSKHVKKAAAKSATISAKRVSPHVLRHYLAFRTMSRTSGEAEFFRFVLDPKST
jgi:integrase/recombinase XerD